MRLDKAIAHAGHGSRREAALWIRDGLAAVDGVVTRGPEAAVEPLKQRVTLRGGDIDYAPHYHIMMNKPAGYISSTDDPREHTVMELLDDRRRRLGLFPVGRLDKDATGLLLLTTDGGLGHSLLSPARHVDKEYLVAVEGILTLGMVDRFTQGITLADGEVCRPASLELMTPHTGRVILREGKYHQIKRMMAALGAHVTAIHRVRMGSLHLDETLSSGQWRVLTDSERRSIYQYDPKAF